MTVDHRDVDIELPALVKVVAGRQVQGPVIGLDPVEVDITEEDRIQGQEAVEHQGTCIVVGIGQAGFDAELAATEEAAGFVIQVGNALRRFRIFFQRLAVGTAGGSWRACGHCLAAPDGFGGGFGQAFGSRCRGCFFDLTYTLLKYHQRLLLCFVTLFQLHEFLF
ncbi:hypothetical protein D3C72_1296060 [compost metagenome]